MDSIRFESGSKPALQAHTAISSFAGTAQWTRWWRLLCSLLLVILAIDTAQAQIVRGFTERASFNDRGNIVMIGNTLLTCQPGGTPDCAAVQAGTVSGSNNRAMQYVNADPGAGFGNSSSAQLALPPGSSVLHAGLYWGGRADPSNADREVIRFRPAGSATYLTINSTQTDTIATQGTATTRPYQGFADITATVQSAGNGEYFVGDLTASLGNDGLGFYGGWSLIVVYHDPAEPFRRLSVFDGAANIAGTTTETINVTGLLTPAAGAFSTFMGALVWEGDEGITGDRFRLDGNDLSDALNPANNFWNSSITRLGTRISAKNPDFVNQLAVDINYVDASGILANSATTAQIEFVTTGDAYFPHALTFAVDLFVPDLVSSLSKSAVDVNGGELLPGDVIEYTVAFVNSGQDGATNVVVRDPIPANTSYVPGTLEILSNATGGSTGPQTDVAGDDLAEFDALNNEVVFRLGQGANDVSGGLVPAGEGASLRFRVQLDNDPALHGQTITNTATVEHNAETLPNFDATGSDSASLTLPNAPTVAKSFTPTSIAVGGVSLLTLTLSNDNPNPAVLSVDFVDMLPAGMVLAGVPATTCGGSTTGVVGGNTITLLAGGSVPAGAPGTCTITANVTGSVAGVLTNTIPAGALSTSNGDNPDPASADLTLTANAPTIAKSFAPGTIPSGGISTLSIVLSNNNDAPAVLTADLVDTMPAGVTLASVPVTTCSGTVSGTIGGSTVTLLSGASIPAGAPGTCTITVDVTSTTPGTATNQIPAGGLETNLGDNPAPAEDDLTVLPDPSISVSKSSDPVSGTAVGAGDTITYTVEVVVANAALTAAFELTDTLSAGLTLGTVTAGAFTCNAANPLVCSLPAGTVPGTYPLSYTATVDADATGTLNNAVVVTGNGGDPDPDCTSCSTDHPVDDPSVSVSKSADPVSGTPVGAGDTITYTVEVVVANAALTAAFELTDTLSAGLTLGTVTAGAFTCNAANPLVCSLPAGTVPGTYPLSYTATVDADATGTLNNAVVVTGNGGDPDPDCTSCSTDHPVQSEVTLVKVLAGESGSLAGVAEPGETLTYTITLTNAGGLDVTGYGVTDQLDANTSFVSADNGGSHVGGVVSWSGLTVPAGGNLVLTVAATVNDPIPTGVTQIANLAYQTGSSPPACPPAGSQCVVLPTRGAISVSKSVNPTMAQAGQAVVYTITVTNAGGVALADVQVVDPLPPGIASFTWTCAGAPCPNAAGSGPIDELVPSFPVAAQLVYTVQAVLTSNPPSPIVNLVAVSPDGIIVCAPSGSSGPCEADATVEVVGPPPLPPAPVPGNSLWMLALLTLGLWSLAARTRAAGRR